MTAPEPTPLEAAAEANFLARTGWRHGDAHDAREVWQQVVLGDARGDTLRSWVDATRPIAEALLAGDWLERVLYERAQYPAERGYPSVGIPWEALTAARQEPYRITAAAVRTAAAGGAA